METICIQAEDDIIAALNQLAKHRSVAPEIIAQEALSRYIRQEKTNIILRLPQLNISEEDARLFLAVKLFEENRISLGKAAEIAGYSERSFVEILINKGIYPIRYEAECLEEDFKNA